jgi:hypothetical protein
MGMDGKTTSCKEAMVNGATRESVEISSKHTDIEFITLDVSVAKYSLTKAFVLIVCECH